MNWIKMNLRFPGVCLVCRKRISVGEQCMWQKSVGVRHMECGEKELACAVCGRPAGCQSCEFRDDCDLERVSKLCICLRCSGTGDPFESYHTSIKAKFPQLARE